MSVTLLVVIVIMVLIVTGVVAFENEDSTCTRKDRKQFTKMTPEEQRKYQETMYKAQAWSNSSSI